MSIFCRKLRATNTVFMVANACPSTLSKLPLGTEVCVHKNQGPLSPRQGCYTQHPRPYSCVHKRLTPPFKLPAPIIPGSFLPIQVPAVFTPPIKLSPPSLTRSNSGHIPSPINTSIKFWISDPSLMKTYQGRNI